MIWLRRVFLQDVVLLKRRQPDHFILRHEIFDTTEFREWETSFLRRYDERERDDPTVRSLEVIMPQVAHVLANLQQEVQNGFSELREEQRSIRQDVRRVHDVFERLDELVTGIKTAARSFLGGGETGATSASRQAVETPAAPGQSVGAAASSSASPAGNSASDSEGLPFKMSRTLTSVREVWREYWVGIGTTPALRVAFADGSQHYRAFRSNPAEVRYFDRRRPIYALVLKLAGGADDTQRIESAIESIERWREKARDARLNPSFDRMGTYLRALSDAGQTFDPHGAPPAAFPKLA